MDSVTNFAEQLNEYIHVRVKKDSPAASGPNANKPDAELSEQSIDTIGMIAAATFLAVMLLTSFIFIGIGAALLLGHILDDLIAAFLIIALCQLTVGMLVWSLRHHIWTALKKAANRKS